MQTEVNENGNRGRRPLFITPVYGALALCLMLYTGLFSLPAYADSSEGGSTETFTRAITLTSAVLGEPRKVLVSLPTDYQATKHTYPLMVLLDGGQYMLHAVASARQLADWRGIPGLIIVGIPSVDRNRDYTHAQKAGGDSPFTRFIVDEVMEYMSTHYRVHPFTILQGHSLGGLYAATELMRNSQAFDAHIILAPSLWWNNMAPLEQARTLKGHLDAKGRAIFFGIGAEDGDGMQKELSTFVGHIQANGSKENRIVHKTYDGEGHMSVTLKANYDGLLHVFGDIDYPQQNWSGFTSEGFRAREKAIEEKYGPSAVLSAENYVELANFLLQKSDFKGAVTVLERNAQVYEGYPPNHQMLGNAKLLADNTDGARIEFKRAHELALTSTSYNEQQADTFLEEVRRIDNPVHHSADEIEQFVGCFRVNTTSFITSLVNEKLMVSIADAAPQRLFAIGKATFKLRVQPEFEFDFASHDTTDIHMQVSAYGTDYQAQRVACEP